MKGQCDEYLFAVQLLNFVSSQKQLLILYFGLIIVAQNKTWTLYSSMINEVNQMDSNLIHYTQIF